MRIPPLRSVSVQVLCAEVVPFVLHVSVIRGRDVRSMGTLEGIVGIIAP